MINLTKSLIVLLSLTGVSFASTLKIGTLQSIGQFYPSKQTIGESNFIRNLINPPIIAVSDDQEWECIVCTKIPTIANGKLEINTKKKDSEEDPKAALVSHWEISPSFSWDDGKPVTGLDVKFTYAHLKSQGAKLPDVNIQIDHKNPRRFSVHYKAARPDFYQAFAFSLLPVQKSQLVKKLALPDENLQTTLAYSKGISYGPYKISYMDGDLVLQENNFYRGLKNDFKTIEILEAKNKAQLKASIAKQKIHMLADGVLDYEDIRTLTQDSSIRPNWKFVHSLGKTTDLLVFNLKNPYLADLKLRQAILHSIDRESLLSDIFDNYGAVSPLSPFESKKNSVNQPSYNLLKAQRILESSGWSFSNESKGSKLELNLIYNKDKLKNKIATRIRSHLGALGIKVNLKGIKDPAIFLERLQKGNYRDLALISIKTFPNMPLGELFHSAAIPSKKNDYTGSNFNYWSNNRVDQALEELDYTYDIKMRKTILNKISNAYIEDIPAIPLMVRPHFGLISANMVNVHFPGYGYHSSLMSSGWSTLEQETRPGLF